MCSSNGCPSPLTPVPLRSTACPSLSSPLTLHHFVPADLPPQIHGHAPEDRRQAALDAADRGILRLALGDPPHELRDRVNRDIARRLLRRVLTRSAVMPPMILRSLDHAFLSEELLSHIAFW